MLSLSACAPIEPNKVKLGDELLKQAGILGYWNFDEIALGTASGGKDFADQSGSGHQGHAIGGLRLGDAGPSKNAVTSNGFGAISIPIDLSHEKVVTLSIWVNPSTSFPNPQNILFEYTADSRTGDGFMARLSDSSASPVNSLLMWLHSPSGFFARTTPTLNPGWHNVVTTFDRSNPSQNSITLYLDGNLVSTTPRGALYSNEGAPFANSTLYLLCRGGTSSCLEAQIDELIMWNRVVTPADIQSPFAI